MRSSQANPNRCWFAQWKKKGLRTKKTIFSRRNRADMINNEKEDKGCLFDLRDKRSLNGFFDRLPCRCAPCLSYWISRGLVSEEKWKTKLFGLNLNLIALVGVRIRLRLEDKQLTSRILPLPGAWMPRMPSVYVCLYRL